MPHSPWQGIGLVLLALIALLWLLRLIQRRYRPHPELVRKALHLAMGSVALSLPWLFAEDWPVILLCGISIALLTALRLVPALRRGPGAVIHSVERRSFGEFCFSAGVLASYLIASGDVLVYAVSILTLTLADPAAAFAGLCCRRPRYWNRSRTKSIQGSAAFFLTAFALAFLSPHTHADVPIAHGLLVALAFAILLTALEAAGRLGTDNLLIPVAAALLIQWLPHFPPSALIAVLPACLAVMLAAAGFRADLLTPRSIGIAPAPQRPVGRSASFPRRLGRLLDGVPRE